MPTQVTASELQSQFTTTPNALLIDLRLAEDFEGEHIANAVNNCVFEVDFLSRMNELASNKTQPITVYGASADSYESRMAIEKLERTGYSSLTEFRGGLQDWKDAGYTTTTGAAVSPIGSIEDGDYPIDLCESRVEWTGRNLINKHWGTIGLDSGNLTFKDGVLVAGEFHIDMEQIKCTDLDGDSLHDILIDHLKSDDFFDTENFPKAKFEFMHSFPIGDATAGSNNYRLDGTLTLKGITKELSLNISYGLTPEGKPAAQADFSFDRTKWNVLYGSGKFFHRLAGHLVNDEISIQLRIIV